MLECQNVYTNVTIESDKEPCITEFGDKHIFLIMGFEVGCVPGPGDVNCGVLYVDEGSKQL